MKKVNLLTACLAIIICGSLFSFIGSTRATSVSSSYSTAVVQDTPGLLQATVTPASGAVTVVQGTSGGTAIPVNVTSGTILINGVSAATSTNVTTNVYTLAATTNAVEKVCVSVEGTAGDALVYMAGTSSGAAVRSLNRCYTANNDGTGGYWEQRGYNGAVTVISVGGTATNNFYITRTTY